MSGDIAICVFEETAIEIDATGCGGETVGKFDSALGVTELAVYMGEIVEALTEAEYG